jgi:regulatory protein
VAYAVIKRGSSGNGWFAIAKEDPPFHISARQLSAWHLSEGQELDERQYQEIKRLKRRDDCQEKALSLLSMREHTTKELKEKLQARGFFGEDIDPVISQLKEEGSLDEARYAESMIRSRQRRNPEGKPLLVQRLVAKGISRDEAARAVDAAFAEQGEAFLSQAVAMARRTTSDQQKLVAKLLRKGFSWSEIKQALS